MEEAILSPPTYKLDFSEQIYCVELSPYEWSQHLICIALTRKITVGILKFQVTIPLILFMEKSIVRSQPRAFDRYNSDLRLVLIN